jgi:kynurenine formamidase
MQVIDLSQTIEPGMTLFGPTAPAPRIVPWMSHQQAAGSGIYQDCSCEISEVHFVTSISTYMDSPFHFDPDGASIETLTLDQLVLPGVVVDCTFVAARQAIGPEVLEGVEIEGRAVLFHTGWSRYWQQPEYMNSPFLSGETASALRDRGAKLAGVDFLVIDDTTNPRRPVHVTLLHNDILIVENLTHLRDLPAEGFTFHAAPVKFKGAAAFPVRAYAVIGENT